MGYYRTYYTPNNAVVAVAGDFETDAMLGRIRGAVRGHSRRAGPAADEQQRAAADAGSARVTVEGPGAISYLEIGYDTPRRPPDPDYYPLVVLDTILGGAKGMSMWGGGTANRSFAALQGPWWTPSWPPMPTPRSAPQLTRTCSAFQRRSAPGIPWPRVEKPAILLAEVQRVDRRAGQRSGAGKGNQADPRPVRLLLRKRNGPGLLARFQRDRRRCELVRGVSWSGW